MTMNKGDSRYEVSPRRVLFAEKGTELKINPLLEGIRALSGEKIQWYLASELRDRIRDSKARVTVIDKLARKQYEVEPRQFEGRLLHQLPPIRTVFGDAYAELYLAEPNEAARVALTRVGTRVIEDLSTLPSLEHAPWASRYVQGLVDVPFLNLTPGTRSGIIQDERFAALIDALKPVEAHVKGLIEEQQRAEEEQASQQSLKAIQKAFHEAMLALPREEYDWFDVQGRARQEGGGAASANAGGLPAGMDWDETLPGVAEPGPKESPQRQFFDFAGPLFGVNVSPASSIVRVGNRKKLLALARDRSRRRVDQDLEFHWQIVEGSGVLDAVHNQAVTFLAPDEPGLTRLKASVRQRDIVCEAEGLITVTHELLAQIGATTVPSQGLPGYTFERAPGESWRSKLDVTRNVIVINNGHRDFVYASRNKSLKLRYLVRLYAKELILRNFAGLPAHLLLERMVELSLRTEEHL